MRVDEDTRPPVEALTTQDAVTAGERRSALRSALVVLLSGGQRHWRDALRRRLLAAADALAVVLVGVALAVLDSLEVGLWAVATLPLWIVVAKLQGLYDRDHRALRHLTADELPSIVVWALVGTALVAAVLRLAPPGGLTLADAAVAFSVAAAADVALRGLARMLWRRVTPRERTLVLGSGPLADATRRKLELFQDIHVQVIDQRDDTVRELLTSADGLSGVERVILASQAIDEADIAELVHECREHTVKLSVIPPARGMFGSAVQLRHVADLPVVEYNTWDASRSTLLLKRAIDLSVASLLLVLSSPLWLAIAVAVKLDSRGPVLFVQARAGRLGLPFRMYKFRTMVVDAEERLDDLVALDELDEPAFKFVDDPRVTRVGRVLRRTSLDELPQLLNVARGEMSLVGPRPEQMELVERYRPEHRFRLDVKPGLTGPMQVFGRGALTLEERLAVERDYIENLSVGRDLRILALTGPAVFSRRGAY